MPPILPRTRAPRSIPVLGLAVLPAACVAYRAAPLDLEAILVELRAPPPLPEREGGLTPAAAAAIAVTRHPGLAATRAALGVARAELVEAGVLPDPELSFDGMDAVAAEVTGGTAHGESFVSGLGLMWPLPRPGAVDAREGAAAARLDEVRMRLLEEEWRLATDVRLAFADVVAARAQLSLDEELLALAEHSVEFFRRARDAGGATATELGLAEVEAAALRASVVRRRGVLDRARQELHRLLGLPPDAEVPLAAGDELLRAAPPPATGPAAATEAALRRRPDLRALLALHRAAEQRLRLAVAEQWPEVAIGTGLAVVLPVLSRLNRPAIDTALAERARIAARVRAAVHEVRAEVHRAVAVWRSARARVEAHEQEVAPRLEALLDTLQRAFRLRAVSAVEVVAAQRQAVDLRRQALEARIERLRARVRLDAVVGVGPESMERGIER